MSLKYQLRRLFWKAGYDISRFSPTSHPLARRKHLLEHYDVNTVLDIGANTGQFAQQLRDDLGYDKRILSFEPLSSAFELLRLKTKKETLWDAFNFALGDVEDQCQINIAGDSQSSSILDMVHAYIPSAPASKYVDTETIKIRTLDSIFSDMCSPTDNIYMKIDTQGFESKVLRGAARSLEHIDTIQVEMSLIPLYKEEMLFGELSNLMIENGYTLVSIEPGYSDQHSGQLLQIDGVFHRFDS